MRERDYDLWGAAFAALVFTAIFVWCASPVSAHTNEEHEAWQAQWQDRDTIWHQKVETRGAVDQFLVLERIELDTELLDWRNRHPCNEVLGTGGCEPQALSSAATPGPNAPPAPAPTVSGDNPWMGLIQAYFREADWGWADRVMRCESQYNPNATNPSSAAAGLFQFIPSTWPWASAGAGVGGASPYDPTANVRAAAWLYYEIGPSQWSCR